MKTIFSNGVVGLAAIVSVEGRVDGANAALFEAHCKQWLADIGRRCLLIDLRSAEYLSSAGLRSILILGKHVKTMGGGLAICGLKGGVRATFATSGFIGLFPVAETPELAADMLKGGTPP
jgi:anti-anti-sigma factor